MRNRGPVALVSLGVLACLAALAQPQDETDIWPPEVFATAESAERHLGQAVASLVVHPGPIRERLAYAASVQLQFPQPQWFPTNDMQVQFRRIQETIYGSAVERESIELMSDEEAEAVARDILALYLDLHDHLLR